MLAHTVGGSALGGFPPNRSRSLILGIFCTYRLHSAGVVTALSDLMVGGPFPAQLLKLQSCPAFLLAGEMPSSREGDRYIFGCAASAATACLNPATFRIVLGCS
jgi:hypothetical protein